jgi:hypothetical protein
MAINKDSVFLLTSADGGKKAFGTGFAVAQQDGRLYLLTCAHVAEQLDGRIQAAGQEAEILAKGSADGVDLALLRIPCEQPPPLLNRTVQGKEGMRFQIGGYGPFAGAKDNYVFRPIHGKLGKSIAFESPGSGRVEAWDLHVDEDDDFSRLQGGYSGSPLCDEQGRLIAVVSHKVDAGQRGHAVAVSNLKSIFPEIERLMPLFSGLRAAAVSPADRIARAGKRFKSLLFDFDLDDSLCKVVRNEFKRMDEEGVAEGDEELLEKIESAAADSEEWNALIRFLQLLDQKTRNSTAGPNYEKLAEQLNSGHVVLCLGQELSHLLGAPFPSTAQIITRLAAAEDFRGPLSELCEQKEIAPESSRAELVSELRALFWAERKTPPAALYTLLTRLERPFLVVSTSYDDMLEQCLHGQRNFVVIAPHMEEKKCLLRYSDQKEVIMCAPEEISQHKPLENGYSVIYRLRGGIISQDGHLLLSERDYFAFARCMEKQFPDYIGSRLKSSLYSLWFLGHHPESWEERLLVKFLQTLRYDRAAALAVQETCSPFVRAFWQDSKVRICDLPLADFVHGLEKAAV